MVKKIVSLVIATALAATLLAGCGGATNPAGTATGAPASQKDVTLTLYQSSTDTFQSRLDMQESFQKDNPKIKLNVIEQTQGTTITLLAQIAAGTAPSCSGGGYPSIAPYVYQNAIMPLDDYIAQTPDFANFDKTQVETFLINGKHYAVPGGKYVMTWSYNKTLFTAAGIAAPPTTWDEFLADAKLLTVPAKQQYGYGLVATVWGCWHFEDWVWGAGGDLTKANPDGTLALTFTDPACITAAEFYRTLKKEKVVQSDISKDIGALQKDYALGKSAMYFGANIAQLVSMGGKAEDYGWFAFPKGPSGKSYTQAGGDASFITYTTDKDIADAAWKYLMYAGSKEQAIITLKEAALKGGLDTTVISARTDVKPTNYGQSNPEQKAIVDDANLNSKLEFYGKGAVGIYADEMVSAIFGDTTTDIATVFKAAEEKAKADVDTFNAGILAGKK